MPTPARRLKRSPRRLSKFYAMIVKVFTLARVAKLADARDLKSDRWRLCRIGCSCKSLESGTLTRPRLQADKSHSRQVLATISATVKAPSGERAQIDHRARERLFECERGNEPVAALLRSRIRGI